MLKVILNCKVGNLGNSGDIITVKNGYARNFLFPEKIAFLWTKKLQKHIDKIKLEENIKQEKNLKKNDQLKAKIQSRQPFIIKMRTINSTDKLFASVKPIHIANALEASGCGRIQKSKFSMLKTIKQLGIYKIYLTLDRSFSINFNIKVTSEIN